VTVIESPSAGDILIANGSPPVEGTLSSGVSSISIGEEEPLKEVDEEDVPSGEQIRVVYLTEQVSHHPPISPWYATVPDRGVEASGVDQISARVAGTCTSTAPERPSGLFTYYFQRHPDTTRRFQQGHFH
jgi:hypothetical protein